MNRIMRDSRVRRGGLGLALVALAAFAPLGLAGPVVPNGKLLITTYWFEGEAVGGDVDGVCPEGAPMPLPWGRRTSQKTYSYMACAAPPGTEP
ncbi:hypothetical protein [Lysobacter enzymogenes]|uniref:hypothetical protein n=1 Tax=Lysobacter enzymogenes TaxID=69 RepID=UPI001A965DDF|nr:hypothetical protein [Lysobacter enzymogenes]QQP96314.1 hypothetical protein JHW38_24445 [Lysobacter enzymogenes]